MSNYYLIDGQIVSSDELYHYGVPGMKWGHRKQQNYEAAQKNYRQAKTNYKLARKAYNKSFDKAYEGSIAGLSPFKKHRQANDARWEDAINKADALNKAKDVYKSAKKKAKATAKAKKTAERAMAKLEKQKQKDFVKARSKEILKGESLVAKMWDVTTGAHKIQAEIEYNTRKYKD